MWFAILCEYLLMAVTVMAILIVRLVQTVWLQFKLIHHMLYEYDELKYLIFKFFGYDS